MNIFQMKHLRIEMKHSEQTTHKRLPKKIKGILIREVINNLYFGKNVELCRKYSIRDCAIIEKMDFNTVKKIGILYLSFLSFRWNAENGIDVEKHAHSPPQIVINRMVFIAKNFHSLIILIHSRQL